MKTPNESNQVNVSIIQGFSGPSESDIVVRVRFPGYVTQDEALKRLKVAIKSQPALLKLLERVEMFNRGVAEGVELLGVAQEAREAVRNALT